MSEHTHPDIALAAILTASYAVHHRVAMTSEGLAVSRCEGDVVSPSTWACAVGALGADADQPQPLGAVDLRLRGLDHVLRWLELQDEAALATSQGAGCASCDQAFP